LEIREERAMPSREDIEYALEQERPYIRYTSKDRWSRELARCGLVDIVLGEINPRWPLLLGDTELFVLLSAVRPDGMFARIYTNKQTRGAYVWTSEEGVQRAQELLRDSMFLYQIHTSCERMRVRDLISQEGITVFHTLLPREEARLEYAEETPEDPYETD
jgi:hypothetical protein